MFPLVMPAAKRGKIKRDDHTRTHRFTDTHMESSFFFFSLLTSNCGNAQMQEHTSADDCESGICSQ